MKILIVDDSTTNLKLLSAQLEAENVTVLKATNGVEGLNILEHETVDAIISDVLMPKMDGYALCQKVRTREKFDSIVFVFYTATYASPGDEQFALGLGADAFFKKPVSVRAILESIESVRKTLKQRRHPRAHLSEESVLREYSDRLVAKLEEKNVELSQQAEELVRLNKAVGSSGEAIFMTDRQGVITYINPEFTRLYGYAAEEVVSKVTPRILKSGLLRSEEYERFWQTILSRQVVKREIINKTKDGRLVTVESSSNPILDERGNIIGFLAIQGDITERKRAEQETGFLQTLSLAIAESQDFESAVRCVLRMVCEATGWVLAEAWVPSADGSCLDFLMIWYENGGARREFERMSGAMTFAMGVGLPGRVWKSKKPEWIRDVSVNGQTFLRASSALKAGLRSGIGVPIVSEDEVLAVLVFFMTEERQEDRRFVDLISSVAAQLGLVFRRKRAEEALHESERQLSLVYENVADIIFYLGVESGDRFRFLSINPAFSKATGLSGNHVLGKLVNEVIPEPSLTMVLGKYKEAISFKKTVRWEETSVYPAGTKHGEVSVTPIFDKSGRCTNLIGAVHDITERKKAEEELRNAEERYRTTLDHMLEGCQIIGFNWEYLYVNDVAAKQGRRSRKELQGHTMMAIYPGIENTPMFRELDRCMTERTAHRMENEFRFPDGTYGWFHLSMEPVPEGVFILSTDVTKERTQEEELKKHREHLEDLVNERTLQLEAVNKELEAFSYSVSHDLRAPLRHIGGFADLLLGHAKEALDEKGQRFLTTISSSAKQMGVLIDELLVFARMGRTEMKKSRVNTELLLKESIDRLTQDTQSRKIEWKIDSLPEVEADPSMLRLVFQNLLDNAVKYTRPRKEAHIEISCKIDHDEFIFSVRDNGVGFDEQYAAKLFGIFQRLHHADEFEGTGVGLANVRRIIHRHGGRTWAESPPGSGATFYFSLPKTNQSKDIP